MWKKQDQPHRGNRARFCPLLYRSRYLRAIHKARLFLTLLFSQRLETGGHYFLVNLASNPTYPQNLVPIGRGLHTASPVGLNMTLYTEIHTPRCLMDVVLTIEGIARFGFQMLKYHLNFEQIVFTLAQKISAQNQTEP